MTVITMQQSGNVMRGRPVVLWSKTWVELGKSKDGWGKAIFSVYADANGYENGTKIWINVNLFRRSFNLWILRIAQHA